MAGSYLYTHINKTTQVHNKKCVLKQISLTGDGTNNCLIDIYDGHSTANPRLMRLRALGGMTNTAVFPDDFVLDRGLYIVFDTVAYQATILSKGK